MKIIELILDEAYEMMGIDAISIVENPAIEENFLTLKSDEIKLAEVNKEKKILMGALLVPNKPIYRTGEQGDYYIYFSKDTVEKASQLYLKNGNQNNSTLEHQHELNGLTLVESWIVEDTKMDKSRKYGLNVPVGTWMGAVKVNNDDVWNDYVKTGKVKGFSIEGYFVDKMERPKDKTTGLKKQEMEEKAEILLSQIKAIVKGEKVELGLIQDGVSSAKRLNEYSEEMMGLKKEIKSIEKSFSKNEDLGDSEFKYIQKVINQIERINKEMGISSRLSEVTLMEKALQNYRRAIKW